MALKRVLVMGGHDGVKRERRLEEYSLKIRKTQCFQQSQHRLSKHQDQDLGSAGTTAVCTMSNPEPRKRKDILNMDC